MNKPLKQRPEDELLLCCARINISNDTMDRIKVLIREGLDWDYFYDLTFRNKLISLVYWNLDKIYFEYVPVKFQEKFKDYYNSNAKKNLLMFGELLKILEKFKIAEIIAIPYKGPILALLAYQTLTLREFGDLDIFIPKEFFFQAENLMTGLGFEPISNLNDNQKKILMKFQREYKFMNDKGVYVEIKWRFPVTSFYFPENPSILCDSTKLLLNNQVLRTLKPENLLLVLCLHNAGHYWSTLRGLCDITELINVKDINWSLIILMAKRLGIERIVIINLYLANNLLDLKLPDDVFIYINSDKSCNSINEQLKERFFAKEMQDLSLFNKISIRICIREKYYHKLRDFTNMMIIPTPSVVESVSLPTFLSPIYYIIRIIQLVRTYVMGD